MKAAHPARYQEWIAAGQPPAFMVEPSEPLGVTPHSRLVDVARQREDGSAGWWRGVFKIRNECQFRLGEPVVFAGTRYVVAEVLAAVPGGVERVTLVKVTE